MNLWISLGKGAQKRQGVDNRTGNKKKETGGQIAYILTSRMEVVMSESNSWCRACSETFKFC